MATTPLSFVFADPLVETLACGEIRRRSFGRFDLRRCAAGSSFFGNDLLQVFDAVTRKGGHAVVADAIDPKAAILGAHVTGKVEEPIFVLAEQVGDVADGKDGADGRQSGRLTVSCRWRLPVPRQQFVDPVGRMV